MVCMMDHVSLPKHVRCEYNEREPFCFARNVCRGSVTFLVFALMGFPYESAPFPSQVASSLQAGGASSAMLMEVTLPCITTSIIIRWSRPCLARLDCDIHTLDSFGS